MSNPNPKPKQSKAKNWTITTNNPTAGERVLFPDGLPNNIKYLIYSIEKGKNEETEHVQGYIQFKKTIRMTTVKKTVYVNTEGETVYPFARSHLEIAEGTADQNRAYCSKSDTHVAGPWEMGDSTNTQGKRVDLEAAYKLVLETGDISKVEPAAFMRYSSSLIKLAALAIPPRRDGLKVICIIGETGIGKSYAAHECYPDLYMPFYGNSGLWWDGYSGQKVVLIEEFRGQVQLQKMLQVLDKYPLRLEIKGGSVPARYELVIVTSNTRPEDWYPDNPQKPGATREPERKALARRLGVGTPMYIEADTRQVLQTQLAIALRMVGVIPPLPQPWLPAPLMPAVSTPPQALVVGPPPPTPIRSLDWSDDLNLASTSTSTSTKATAGSSHTDSMVIDDDSDSITLACNSDSDQCFPPLKRREGKGKRKLRVSEPEEDV